MNKNVKKLSFMPLGGVDDINRNCYVVEYGNDILVMDLGISFPEDTIYGIDYFIPDVSYLKKRKNNIAGIVLTHAHLDHIGAIPHVIEELGFPTVYGRQFTIMLLKEKLREHKLDKKVKFEVIEPNRDMKIGPFSTRWIPITHAIPQSCSILIETPAGRLMYTGDFKFDEKPVNEPLTDYAEFKKVGDKGLDLLCIDSTNVFEEGKALSETEVYNNLERIISRTRGRVLVATFSSLGTRLYSLTKIAQKLNKKIAVTGYSMKGMLSILRRINYIDVPDSLFIDENDIKKYPDDKLLILTTGTQGEDLAALSRMARGEHRNVKIRNGDTVILSSSVIPGNAVSVQHLIDDLFRLGARVIHKAFMDVHTSGHGYQEDMKKMVELTRPRNVMPVHGWPSFRDEMAYLLKKWGVNSSNILMASTGQKYEFNPSKKTWFKKDKYPTKDIFVDAGRVGVINPQVLSERQDLAEYGFVIGVIKVDQTHRMVGKPEVVYKGSIHGKTPQKVEEFLSKKFQGMRGKKHKLSHPEIVKLEKDLRNQLENMIKRETAKSPIVEVTIV